MSHAELMEWQQFYELEPFGDHIADLRAGQICATVANVHRDTKAKREPFSPLDFVPWNSAGKTGKTAEPILLDDPEAQSELIVRTIFGGLVNKEPK